MTEAAGFGAPDDGFHEACAIVRDLDDSIARLGAVFGYRLMWRGDADPAALDLMGVAPGWSAVEALIGDPAQGRGHIRLFAFPGRDTGVMRDGAQPWDTGGLFDVNIRSLGPIGPIHAAMTRAGFCAFAPVTAWDFGPLSVRQVVARDADGLAIAVIERVAPPLDGFGQVVGPASHVFNAAQIVPSFAAARALYVDALGWQVVREAETVHAAGVNCMGLPLDVARTRTLRIGLYQAQGRSNGSVEVIDYAGESLDFSRAAPPDRGWAALRFPVADVDGFVARAVRGGCTARSVRRMRLEPYGEVEAAAVRTPWGATLEVYRPV